VGIFISFDELRDLIWMKLLKAVAMMIFTSVGTPNSHHFSIKLGALYNDNFHVVITTAKDFKSHSPDQFSTTMIALAGQVAVETIY